MGKYYTLELHVGAHIEDIIHTLLVTFCAQQNERGDFEGGAISSLPTTIEPPFMAIRFDSQAGQNGGNTTQAIRFDEELRDGNW